MAPAQAVLPGIELDALIDGQVSTYDFTNAEWDAMAEAIHEVLTTYQHEKVIETLPEWMERKMVVTEGLAPGPWRFEVTPYLREIAWCLSFRSGVTEVAVIKGNQGGFSKLSHGRIGYCVEYGVGPGLFISGDASMAEDQFEKRVYSVIYAAGLEDRIKPIVARKSNKTSGERKDIVQFNGTFIRAVGPRSEAKLRSDPIRNVDIEEVDVFPQNLAGKGNPIEKAIRRTDSYGPLRKIYYNSTPKTKLQSQIEPLYESGDKRLYFVPCKSCGHMQPLVWGGFKWDKKPDGSPAVDISEDGTLLHDPAYYECQNCGAHWKNSDKPQFLRDREAGGMELPDGRRVWAEWRPTKKPDRPGMRSYKWPSLYSPFRSWLDIVLQFWRVKEDPVHLPDFINDVLAETWEESVQTPKAEGLAARAEDWETGQVPNKVLFTTLAADIQANRIEVGLHGWGRNRESWHLNYWVFEGTTAEENAPCWNELEQVVTTEVVRTDGVNLGKPMVSFIDAGYLQPVVNAFCDRFIFSPKMVDGVYPVIGKENQAEIYKAHKNDISTPLVSIHDQDLKKAVYAFLKRPAPVKGAAFPYGFVHFPRTYGPDYYAQLTAEDFVIDRDARGKERARIDNVKQRRNEVLDVAKMNMGALYFACLRWYELENQRRRSRKLKEIEVDWNQFFSFFDDRVKE